MLAARPELVNAVGPHPFWGGRPQALHVAIEGRRRDLFDLLLDHGADVNGHRGLRSLVAAHDLDRPQSAGDARRADSARCTPIDAMSRPGERGRALVNHLVAHGVHAAPAEYARLGDRETLARLAEDDPRGLASAKTSIVVSNNPKCAQVVAYLKRVG